MKTDLKAYLVWTSKDGEHILTQKLAPRMQYILHLIAIEEEINIIAGKVTSNQIHLFIQYHHPQDISKIAQRLKWLSSEKLCQEFPHLRVQFGDKHIWAEGYLTFSTDNIPSEMIQDYLYYHADKNGNHTRWL